MPGVPSGRGCEACRQQKKKCDQAKPACARCARLDIPCKGAGQQRYKFLSTTHSPSPGSSSGSTDSPGGNNTRASKRKTRSRMVTVQSRSREGSTEVFSSIPLSNSETLVMSQFLDLLKVSDIRYNVRCYGSFLESIPRRLGKNKALDAATEALIAVYPLAGHGLPAHLASRKYGKALATLRTTLDDPETGRSLETLAAIYMVMLTQLWLGRTTENNMSHGEGMACLLNSMDLTKLDEFGGPLFSVLCFLVALERVINPRVKLGPGVWQQLKKTHLKYGPQRPNPSDGPCNCDLVSLRPWVFVNITTCIAEPDQCEANVLPTYERLREEVDTVSDNIDYLFKNVEPEDTYKTQYGLLFLTQASSILAMAFIFNCFLQIFQPHRQEQWERDYEADWARLEKLVGLCMSCRPLGAGHMIPCIVAALLRSKHVPARQQKAEEYLDTFIDGFPRNTTANQVKWFEIKLEILQKRVTKRRKLEEKVLTGTNSIDGNVWRSAQEEAKEEQEEEEEEEEAELPAPDTSCTIL